MGDLQVATYIGHGMTLIEAVRKATEECEEANRDPADRITFQSLTAQTLWHESEQVFYHIITYAFQFDK